VDDPNLARRVADVVGVAGSELTEPVVAPVFQSGGDLGPRTSTVTENNDWVVTYTPIVMWTPGMLTVTGKLTATGTWIVDTDSDTAEANLSTPTPLTLDPECATGITAGLVKGTYGEGHEITVTWTACGQRTVTST
jgi:hypothetical protein